MNIKETTVYLILEDYSDILEDITEDLSLPLAAFGTEKMAQSYIERHLNGEFSRYKIKELSYFYGKD